MPRLRGNIRNLEWTYNNPYFLQFLLRNIQNMVKGHKTLRKKREKKEMRLFVLNFAISRVLSWFIKMCITWSSLKKNKNKFCACAMTFTSLLSIIAVFSSKNIFLIFPWPFLLVKPFTMLGCWKKQRKNKNKFCACAMKFHKTSPTTTMPQEC